MSTIAEEPSGGEDAVSNDGSEHSAAENMPSCITLQVNLPPPHTLPNLHLKRVDGVDSSKCVLHSSVCCLSLSLSLSFHCFHCLSSLVFLSCPHFFFSCPLCHLQRVTGVSVRHKKPPPSTVLMEGWMVHYTNKLALVSAQRSL